MSTIDEFEARLQKLLESRLLQVLPGHKPEDQLAQQLVTVMHANLKRQADGTIQAPNAYTIVAHPAVLAAWHAKPRQLDVLANALRETGGAAGLTFTVHPKISTASDDSMTPGEFRILATFSEEGLAETRDMPSISTPLTNPDSFPSNAFLILHGTKIIPLTQSVINIGRRLDNQIVVDDPRVSRNHAQLRVIKGRFVIFDLDSTGGLFVNGQRSSQCVLYPGDVISLAGVTLVFGQDTPTRRSDQEHPISFSPADRPTTILKIEKDKTE